jgi:anti-anti-sigma factor
MGVHVETKADLAVIKLSGNFFGDRETDKLRHVFRQLVSEGNLKLIIDLGKVSNLNSIALGTLVRIHTNYANRGGRIVLANLDKKIEDILTITKLARVFEIGPDMAGALAKLEI